MNRQRGPAGFIKASSGPVYGSHACAMGCGLGVVASVTRSPTAGALALPGVAGIASRIHGALSLMMGLRVCSVPVSTAPLDQASTRDDLMVTMRGRPRPSPRTSGQHPQTSDPYPINLPRSRCRYFSSFSHRGHAGDFPVLQAGCVRCG